MVRFITVTVGQERLLEGVSFMGFRNFLFLPVFHKLSLRILVCERKHVVSEVCTPSAF